MENLTDKILGSMIGGAVGDALGYSVEFMRHAQIIAQYGPNGIARYDLNDKGLAEISDDTQMSLYTAYGLLSGDIKEAYLEWLKTQTQQFDPSSQSTCWLSNEPEMFSQRAPGTTCMSSLQSIAHGFEPNNNSKGCGGIMRVAPIALYGYAHAMPIAEVAEKACYAARLTHQHPLGFLSAGLMATVLYQILSSGQTLSDNSLHDFTLNGIQILSALKTEEGTLYETKYRNALEDLRAGSALALKCAIDTKTDDSRNIPLLGQGWTGEEAWFISLYCALKHIDNFEDAIVASVNHSGDSDSTGSITGNLMGAIHGYNAIPQYFTDNLELHDTIAKMATQLTL